MENLEKYLCSVGDRNILAVIEEGVEEGKLFWPESGETFKWVSILRAADLHWSNKEAGSASFALFRMRSEGIVGNSPQIIVRCRDRYNYYNLGLTFHFIETIFLLKNYRNQRSAYFPHSYCAD